MRTFNTYLSLLFVFLMFSGVGEMKAQDTTDTSKDTIQVQIELPNGNTARQDTLTEGDTLALKGLPFPLHIMNGGKLAFSDSSLSHDITITITLPGFANVNDRKREVSFGDSLASGARFKVSAADTTIDPFKFDHPVTLTLPIPKDLPNEIGDQVSNFVLAYRDSTGSIDTTGINTTVADTVKGIVSAEVSHFSDVVMTPSGDSTSDSNRDMVSFEVKTPNGNVARSDSVAEGDTLTLTGLPFPLQYLNGSELALPDSAIPEHVNISVSIPDFANINNQKRDVSFGDSVASSVKFTVSQGDSVVSPFEFDTPVTLTLNIPQDLPDAISNRKSDFVLAFRDSTGATDTTGIETMEVDTAEGVVSARVSHFSTISMGPADGTATSIEPRSETTPQQFKLYSNYPNPFNPATTIQYDLKEASHVKLTVYNIIGRKVATLVNKDQRSGHYKVRFDASGLSSGMYIYRIQAGNFTSTQKMTLIK